MAIPVGTTSRQLATVARTMLAGVVVVGMLTWCRPGFRLWGALAAGLLATWMVWLIWRTTAGDRTMPGHPFHLALLGPAGVLTYHLARTGLGAAPEDSGGFAGALNISMIFQISLLALGVMLAQSLLPRAAGHVGVLSICGAAMTGGAGAAIVWGWAEPAGGALAFLGFGGVCVWLTPLWGAPRADRPQESPHPSRRHGLQIGCLAVAAAAAAVLAWASPTEALLTMGVTGATLILGGLIFHQRRIGLVVTGGSVAAGAAIAMRRVRPAMLSFRWLPVEWLGRGEEAFKDVQAGDSGLAVLGAVVGRAGLLWLLVGIAACVVWSMWHARRGHRGDQGRAIVWTTATALVSCALLAGAGPFLPAVTLAAALAWGLLPTMLAQKTRPRPGAILLGVLIAVLLLLGTARSDGLLMWTARAYGVGELFLHGAAGFLLAMVLAWLMGAGNGWLGLLGIVLAILAGGAGEVFQGLASPRGMELSDWLAHAVGGALAAPLYVLCRGSRWCESPDARAGADGKIPCGAGPASR